MSDSFKASCSIHISLPSRLLPVHPEGVQGPGFPSQGVERSGDEGQGLTTASAAPVTASCLWTAGTFLDLKKVLGKSSCKSLQQAQPPGPAYGETLGLARADPWGSVSQP